MTIDKLSPDEINGLLAQGGKEENPMPENLLTKIEKEAFTELLNVSLGSSSTALSKLFSEKVTVMTPELSIKQKDDLLSTLVSPLFVVLGEYSGEINGIQILSINKEDVEILTKMVVADSEVENRETQLQVLKDVVQQMFDSVSQSMSTVLDQEVSHSLSGIDVVEKQKVFSVAKFTPEEWFVGADFELKIGSQKSVTFSLSITVRLAKHMVSILTESMDEEYPEDKKEMPLQSFNQSKTTNKTIDLGSTPNIQSVQFSSFDETVSPQSESNNLSMLLDIPLQVTVELGRTKRLVKEILEISQGSIIELDKLAGEPVNILINNKLIAVGEVVVIDENFGVRVTDILSTADRISKLR